jgi:hypothetical protein
MKRENEPSSFAVVDACRRGCPYCPKSKKRTHAPGAGLPFDIMTFPEKMCGSLRAGDAKKTEAAIKVKQIDNNLRNGIIEFPLIRNQKCDFMSISYLI